MIRVCHLVPQPPDGRPDASSHIVALDRFERHVVEDELHPVGDVRAWQLEQRIAKFSVGGHEGIVRSCGLVERQRPFAIGTVDLPPRRRDEDNLGVPEVLDRVTKCAGVGRPATRQNPAADGTP